MSKLMGNMLPKHDFHVAAEFSHWHHKLRTCIFVTCGAFGVVQQGKPISMDFYWEDNTKLLAFIFVCVLEGKSVRVKRVRGGVCIVNIVISFLKKVFVKHIYTTKFKDFKIFFCGRYLLFISITHLHTIISISNKLSDFDPVCFHASYNGKLLYPCCSWSRIPVWWYMLFCTSVSQHEMTVGWQAYPLHDRKNIHTAIFGVRYFRSHKKKSIIIICDNLSFLPSR